MRLQGVHLNAAQFASHLRPFCSEATILWSAHAYALKAARVRAVCSVQWPLPAARASRACVGGSCACGRICARAELGSILELGDDPGCSEYVIMVLFGLVNVASAQSYVEKATHDPPGGLDPTL